MDNQNPFMDHAAPVLASEPAITDQQKSDLWDAFHSKSPEELIQHLTPLAVPDDLKKRLIDAKRASVPTSAPVDKITDAVNKIAHLDPQVRQTAEASPNLLKAFTAAATTPEKPAQEAASTTSAAPKGPKTPAASKALQPPRADGQPHFPAIPDGHKRVLASDGGVHDIPEENIEKARVIDPNLHVLNPEA